MNFHFIDTDKKTVLIEDDDNHVDNSNICWLCDNGNYPHQIKVRHHCHLTSRYSRTAHENSKLQVKKTNFVLYQF